MERIATTPRPDWQTQIESLGLNAQLKNTNSDWNEEVCYRFSAREIQELKNATDEIQQRCLELVEDIILKKRYAELRICDRFWPLIEDSWLKGERSLYGRLDFSYDGSSPPRLLEYNADTALGLLESSLFQKQWLAQVKPCAEQFNHIHSDLLAAWRRINSAQIHLACYTEYQEIFFNVTYLANTVREAGFSPTVIDFEHFSWDGQMFFDQAGEPIKTLFKLYPWDWISREVLGRYQKARLRVIEPTWKMLLSNKSMLALLWKMFPGHPNLLPAFFDHRRLVDGHYVEKPLVGREGQNITLYTPEGVIETAGYYKDAPVVYQKLHLLPNFGGHYALVGSWVIGGRSAGIVVREDKSPITLGGSHVVPHYYD